MISNSDRKKCLIVGYGSVGSRHASLLSARGQMVACLSSRQDIPYPVFNSLQEAVNDFRPEVIIIANRTVDHQNTWNDLVELRYSGSVLVEKPLFISFQKHHAPPPFRAFVAYNLRFHPIVRRIKELLSNRTVYSAQLVVGQYLPSWRPGTDYRNSYSAFSTQGGGVLRDLSHELDLALWLFGQWQQATAVIGRWGDLEIDSEDCADILACMENCCSLSIHLDYQNIFPRRTIAIQAEGLSIFGDLITGIMKHEKGEDTFTVERNYTYEAQLDALLTDKYNKLCSWEEGVDVLRFIDTLENSSRMRHWEKK